MEMPGQELTLFRMIEKERIYKINEIFYSLQGEGYYTGTAAGFIRFSGCNLKCPFCDTRHENGSLMELGEIISAVSRYPARHTVLTGGEPSLWITDELTDALHRAGKYIAVETNGIRPLPEGVDWITCSPKTDIFPEAEVRIDRCDELKAVYNGQDMSAYGSINATHRFIQPCDTGDPETNRALLAECIRFCKAHPEWRLSLQTHKYINIR